jgi:hypothetical protein
MSSIGMAFFVISSGILTWALLRGLYQNKVQLELMECAKREGLIPAVVSNFADAEVALQKSLFESSTDPPCLFACVAGPLRFLDKAIHCLSLGQDNRRCCHHYGVR